MRYDKQLYAPEERFIVERVDPSRLGEGQTAALYHLRQTDDGLIAAEGSEIVTSLPSAASLTKLYATGGDVYVYGSGTKVIYGLTSGIASDGVPTEPVAVLSHFTHGTEEGIYSVEEDAVHYIRGNAVQHTDNIGGTCAAIHHGRLFTAKGYRLTFSAPHSAEGIVQTGSDPDKACYLDFDKERGEIVALVSFRERLYIFFRRGIVRLSAEGEAADFAATAMPFAGGEVVKGSVASCGDRICYLTERGLWAFDGSKNTFLERQDEINLTAPVNASDFKGRYGAAVSLKTKGKNAVYVYDFVRKAGRFLTSDGLSTAAGEYYLSGNRVYRFIEAGKLPADGGSVEISFRATTHALAWVRVVGIGEFEIRTNVKSGVFAAKAGQKIRINAKEKSDVTKLSIAVKDTAFRIFAVDVGWRESDAD